MKQRLLIITALLWLCLTSWSKTIYKFDINDDINSRMWVYTQQALKEAEAADADIVLVHMNTYGGEVVYADSIRTAILNSERPVIVFIDNNAASAGALISIACDRIYMRPGANIGAATVVNGTDGKEMPDKYQSYMRATMRSTAESHGKDTAGQWIRNPEIAEAMVDDRIAIENIIDSGRTLTFTAEEALRNGYCEGIVDSIPEILVLEGLSPTSCTITEYKPSGYDNLKGWLTHTALRSILIMIIVGGIWFELQSPGIGFPLAASITAAILYFAPLYMDGLAAYWEIGIFIIGLVLLALELFVIPGFGLVGISGIICLIIGLGFAMVGNIGFDFTPVAIEGTNGLSNALSSMFIGLSLGFVVIIWISHKIGTKGIWNRMALQKEQTTEDGYLGVPQMDNALIGTQGVAVTDLRPAGKIEVGGRQYDALSRRFLIEKGSVVVIKDCKAGQLYVDKK